MKHLLLLSALLLLPFTHRVHAEDYKWFHHIHNSSDAVRTVCPDSSGRVWFGTIRGIFRYGDCPDAVHYDLYPEEFHKGVDEIDLFPDNRLLVRTQNDSVYVYNPRTNVVESGLEYYFSLWGIDMPVDKTLNIKGDYSDAVLFYNGQKVYRKDADKEKAVLLAEDMGDIYDVDMFNGQLCVLTDSILYNYSPYAEDKNYSYAAHGIEFHRKGVWTRIDAEGNIWVGSESLYRFEAGSMKKDCIIEDISIMDILRNRSGDILVATGVSGILHFGNDGKIKQKLEHKAFDQGTLVSNNIRHLSEGLDGSLWVCYNKSSVSVSLPGRFSTFRQHISPLVKAGVEENVISMAQAPDGTLWLGTDGQGIWCKNPDDGMFYVPQIELTQPSVTALSFDSEGRTWVGTYLGGIYCMDGQIVKRIMPNASCYDIIEDSRGTIWAGMHGQDVYHFPEGIDGPHVKIDMGAGKWVFKLEERGDVIYAATSGGLFSINKADYSVRKITGNRSGTQSLRNSHFRSMITDSRGLIWLVGNQSECSLEIYDVSRDTLMYIPQMEGQIVKSVVEDDDRCIWLATDEHIIQVFANHDPYRQEFSFHTSEYRFRSQDQIYSYNNSRAALSLSDGSVIFGGTAGFLQFYTSEFPPYTPLPKHPVISISSLKINDEHIVVGKSYDGNVILNEDISKISRITLKHNQNNVSLGVSVQDYVSPFETSIYYRMPKDDLRWKNVRGKIVELNRLSPGVYDVEICSGNPDGTLSSRVIPFVVEIQAPWYLSKGVIALYVILIITIIAILVYYYIRHNRIRHETERQRQLNELKLRFFTNISHDFRTPLTLIITPLEAHLAAGVSEAEDKFLRPIYRNAVRLLNLVNEVLDLRKLETIGASLNLSYGNIVSFLSDICSSFQLFAEETERNLVFYTEHKDIMTAFDKDKLSKVIMNLLSNAFKYASEQGKIVLSVDETSSDVVISISDNGPGIPDQYKEKIFDRFFQYQLSTTQSGTGIGLHIVREYVRLHGGSVSVSDNLPTGAVFTVILPKVGKKNCGCDVEDGLEEYNDAVCDSNGVKHLLLVEDNKEFLNFMKGQLSDQYTVLEACNGREALDILASNHVDMIISDIMMDEMNGLELCHHVKTNLATSHIPFIMLTAKALAEDELEGLEAGADEYVTKPFNMQILRMRISKLLDAHLKFQNRFSDKLEIEPSEIMITSLDEQFLSKAVQITEENMSDTEFSVDQLSKMLGMHRANLYKKLLSLTGKTPVEFIRLIRLKRAAQYLVKSQLYISEIAYRVGFKQPKVFSQHFKEEYGMTPREYQKQHEE